METFSGSIIWIVSILLAVYLIFVSWIGKKGAKYSKSMKGFATARGSVNPWIVGASFAATYASANLFIGVPGLAYQYGTSVLWYTLGCFGVSWIGLLLFAKTFWRYGKKFGGVSTLPEWLGKRYNSKILQVLVALLILFNVYYIVGQNVGLATIFETLVGIPYFWGIVIGVVITILYIGIGGAYAQLITDGIQGIFMSVTALLILISLLWTIGGGLNVFGVLGSKLEAIDPHLVEPLSNGGNYNSVMAIVTIQFLLFSFVLMPHLLNKVLSLETEEQLRPFTLSAGIFLFLMSTLIVLGGLAARVLQPSIASIDQALPVYLLEAFPPVVVAFMFVGVISAILSSTDSLYLGITSSIGNDMYKVVAPLLPKYKGLSTKALDEKSVKVAKLSLVFIGLLTFYISLDRPDSLAILIQFSFSAIISGVIAPISLGYIWKRATRLGAILSLVTGTLSYVVFTSFEIVPNIFVAMFFSSLAGFIVMFIAGLLLNQKENEESYLIKNIS
jgi:sodium/pantothenate symporter